MGDLALNGMNLILVAFIVIASLLLAWRWFRGSVDEAIDRRHRSLDIPEERHRNRSRR